MSFHEPPAKQMEQMVYRVEKSKVLMEDVAIYA
jgi:hypothetical protein